VEGVGRAAVARPDVDSRPQARYHLQERLREAGAHVEHRGGAAANRRPQAVLLLGVDPLLAARVARAAAAGPVADEVAAEVVGLGVVHQEDVRRVAAGVRMAVDEARRDELPPRVDGAVGLVDDDSIAQQLVTLPVEADDPAALDQRAHAALPLWPVPPTGASP